MSRWPCTMGWLGALPCLALLAGCHGPAAPAKTIPKPAENTFKPSPVSRADRYVSKLAAIPRQPQPAAAKVAGFTWKPAPTASDVPDQPVTGMVGGVPFICRYASVIPDEEDRQPTLWLRFSDKPRGKDCAFVLDDNNVDLEWHEPVGTGEFVRSLEQEAPLASTAFFTLEQPGGTVLTGSRYNWGCCLRIDEERGPTETGGISSLKGRIALVFDDPPNKSWIAGTFVADGCRFEP